MWYASDDSPQPSNFTGFSKFSKLSLAITKNAAPSPKVIPCLFLLKGFVISEETASNPLKPTKVVSEAISIPPTIAASTIPDIINSAPLIIAQALEEHAVLKVFTGPDKSYFSAIKVET